MDQLCKLMFKPYRGQAVRLVQKKYDGYYMEIYKDKDFGVWCNFKDQDNNIWDKLSKIESLAVMINSLPDGTCLRTELFASNVPATSVITLLNEADDRLDFRVFEYPPR